MTDDLVLTGLDGSNPLAFLAALGTLRLATLRWPEREVTLSWTKLGAWRPVLSGVGVIDQELCEALLQAPSAPVALFQSLGNNIKVPHDDFASFAIAAHELTVFADRRAGDFAACFASEVCQDDKTGTVQYTNFCFITGSGHQHFLGSAKALVAIVTQEHLWDALFGRMAEDQKSNSFRWNPCDASEYALRWKDPSKDGSWTSWGANRLAFEALPLYPVHPRGRDLETTGFHWANKRSQYSWPIWKASLAVDEVRSLIAFAEIHHPSPDPARLASMGVAQVFRSTRVRIGQGANFKVSFRPARAL